MREGGRKNLKMKLVPGFFFFCLCVVLVSHRIVAEDATTNLVPKACALAQNGDKCVASLESNPDSKQANLPQLGIIALRLASANATDTSVYIKKLLNQKGFEPAIEQALTDCSDQYLDAIQQLDSSLNALLFRAYNDMRTWVQAATADIESCQYAFKDHPSQSLLSSRNAIFRQLCNNALVIYKMLNSQQ